MNFDLMTNKSIKIKVPGRDPDTVPIKSTGSVLITKCNCLEKRSLNVQFQIN